MLAVYITALSGRNTPDEIEDVRKEERKSQKPRKRVQLYLLVEGQSRNGGRKYVIILSLNNAETMG